MVLFLLFLLLLCCDLLFMGILFSILFFLLGLEGNSDEPSPAKFYNLTEEDVKKIISSGVNPIHYL